MNKIIPPCLDPVPAGIPQCYRRQEYLEASLLVVLLFASPISHPFLLVPREPMFSLPVLTERVSLIYLQRIRMRAISLLELVIVPPFKPISEQETD